MDLIELTPVRDTLHLAPSIAPKIALPTLTDLTTKIPTPAELLQGINTPQEKVEKDPYKLAEEAYFKKKKPKIDTSSSIAPTETITPEEYNRFNSDDTISSSVKYDPNYEANKRATQTDWERWGNTAQKFGANATSMFLGGLSTIPNILGSVTNGIGYLAGQQTPISEYFNMSPDSGVMKDLFEWSDGVNANNRNYQSNWSKENWIQDLVPFFGDGGFQDIVASAGYTAGAIGEAILSGGIASILSKGTKLAGMGAKLSKYLNDPAKIDKVLNAISATKNSKAAQLIGDAGYLMGKSIENSPQLYRAYVGAHVEAAFEGLEGAKRFEEDVVNEYKKNHGGIAPDEKELAKIKDLAQNVGDLRYKLNLLTLTIPNYIQMGALLKTFPGASKVAKTLLGKNELGSVQLGDELGTFKVNAVNDIKFNTTNALWDKRIPKAFKTGVEKTLSYGQKFGKIPLSISEGLEEEMQYFIDEHTTSLYKGAYLNEKGLEENSLYLSGLWDTIQNKLATKEATQAFLMGSMGGGIQQSMNTVYETVFDKNKLKEKIAQNELYAKKLEDISGSLFKSSDVFNVATDDERVQLENYLSKALDQNSLNGTLQENYQKVLASLNTNAATNVAIQKNFLGAQRIYQDLQDRDVSGLLHSVVSSGKQEVFKEHLNSIANATEEEIQNLYGININEQTRDNKQFAKNLISKLNQIEGYSKKIGFAFNDTFDNETDNQFYSMYKQQLSHNLYMMNRKQERISDLQTANSALFLDLLQDKKQSINDKIEELKTATSLVPIKDATKRIALLEQLKDGSNVSLKDAVYAYSGESVAELEAVAEFEKANDVLTLKEGRTGIDNLRKYYEELYSTDGFELFKDQHKDYYDAIKAVREFQQKSADRKIRNEKQYAQLQKDLLVKDDGENIKKAVQKLSEDVSNVEDDEKLTKEQKESKKQFLINEAKQKIANLRNSKPVETVEKKTPKTETTKETEIVETPAVEVKDVIVEEITTDVAQKFSEAPLNKEEDLEDVSIDDFDEEEGDISIEQLRIQNLQLGEKILKSLGYKIENRQSNGNVKGGQSGWKIRFNIKSDRNTNYYNVGNKLLEQDKYFNQQASVIENWLNNYFGTKSQGSVSEAIRGKNLSGFNTENKSSIWKFLSGGEQGESDFTIYIGSGSDVLRFIEDVQKSPIYSLLTKGNQATDTTLSSDGIIKGRIEGASIGFKGYHTPENLPQLIGKNYFSFIYNDQIVDVSYGDKNLLSEIHIHISSKPIAYSGIFDQDLKKDFPDLYQNIRNIIGFQLYGKYLELESSNEQQAAPLIDEEGNVNQGNVAPIVVDVKAAIERRRQETLLKELFEKPETESDYFGKKIFEGDKIGDKGFEIQINSRIFIGRIDVSIKYLKYVKSQKYYYEGAKQYARDTKESIIKDFNSINEALNYAINLLNDEDKQLALKINAKYDEELAALETPVVVDVKADIERRRQEDSKKSPKDSVFYKLIERLSKGAITLSNLLENLGSTLNSPIKTNTGEILGISFNQGESRFNFIHKGKNLVGYFVDGKWEIGKLNEKGNYNYINYDEIQDINKKYGSQEEFLKSVNKELVNDIENFEKLKYTPEEINSNIIPLENSISNKADELRIKYGNTYLLQDFLRQYDAELFALETPVVNLPFDNTNLLGALSTENTIPEILLTEAQGLKILQPEYYLAVDLANRDEAIANLQRRKELLNSVTNLSEIPTTIKEETYPAKSINKTTKIYGDVFVKLGGGKLYHLLHIHPETDVKTILYEFRSLKHGFGLQKTWVDTSYPRIVEELKNTDGLLETTGKDGFTNKPFFFGDFSSYYSLYDVWNLMNEDERSDFLHKFNIRADQMQEAFDTQNVFEKLLSSPNEKYELNRILDGWVDAHRGTEVSSYAVDFKTQTTIDTLPQSKFIDVETGAQHHVVVYADFELLYDEEGNLKKDEEYKLAKTNVIKSLRIYGEIPDDSLSRIRTTVRNTLIQQLDSTVLEPVHFLSSGYNLVLSDTNGKPYIKSLFPSTDLKENEVLNKNLHALVESADWNGKSTREAGFHILLNNLSKKVGYRVEVSNVKFNFYTKQDGKQVRSIAVTLEWVEKDAEKKDIKKSKTLHISLKENLIEEGRYEKNIKEISDGLIPQIEKEFGLGKDSGISVKFVAAEAKEPVDVPTILKNNNTIELGVYWNTDDFRKNTPVLFNSDRVIPRIVEQYEQELKEETSVALPVVSTKVEEAVTKTAAPIEQSDVPPIQAIVNKHVGEKGMILQKDENITSEKALLFGADVVKIMEQSKDIEQMLNEALEFSKTENENSAHEYIQSVLSYLYFDPEFIRLRPYFNTQPKPIDSNCVLTQN